MGISRHTFGRPKPQLTVRTTGMHITGGSTMAVSDVALVGAGPYGLSIAAHLRTRGIDHRIFGPPLETWRCGMPTSMLLKSDGFASDLSSPSEGSRLADYCLDRGISYHDTDIPVSLETFVDYGLDFQRRFVPHLEPSTVTLVTAEDGGFRIDLSNAESLHARRVVMAVGITHFATMPQDFADVSPGRVTHSSQHSTFEAFAGRDVTVVGAGASAVDVAIELARAGAHSRLVARRGTVRFASGVHNEKRSFVETVKHPGSGLGPGWRSRVCCDAPDGFRLLPVKARSVIVKRHLGPSSPWYLRDEFLDSVEVWTGTRLGAVKEDGSGPIRLELVGDDAEIPTVVETDSVICATGYRADLSRLTMLDHALRQRIRTVNDAPALNPWFESSVPGLFFVGNAAAMSFGPLMRFMYGDTFTARRLAHRLSRTKG
jgi:thioredoxin reductase